MVLKQGGPGFLSGQCDRSACDRHHVAAARMIFPAREAGQYHRTAITPRRSPELCGKRRCCHDIAAVMTYRPIANTASEYGGAPGTILCRKADVYALLDAA